MRRYAVYSLVVVSAFAVAFYFKPNSSLSFNNVSDVAGQLRNSQFSHVVLNADSVPIIVVSDSPITQKEALDYQSRRILLPNTGKVVFINVRAQGENPDCSRIWGNVTVIGDPLLIDKLNQFLR